MRSISYYAPMIEHFEPRRDFLRSLLWSAIGAAAIAFSAQIEVPMVPVPMTLQSLMILLVAMVYGCRLATAAVALYLLEGVLGVPVFAGFHGGVAYAAGPTGGYLLGFMAAAAAVGFLAESGWSRTVSASAMAMLVGHLILFIPGILWLAMFTGFDRAIDLGLTPFLLGSALKIAIGALVMPFAWRAAR